MNDYYDMLREIAEKYHIHRGQTEAEGSWISRVIYSYLGQVGYSSLFDITEDEQPSSITHFKSRIEKVLSCLQDMYPDTITHYEFAKDKTVSDEIFDIMISSGCVYHAPYRLSPSIRKTAKGEKMVFLRGQALNETYRLSGLGAFYLKGKSDNSMDKSTAPTDHSVNDMFCIPTIHLTSQWNEVTSKAKWVTTSLDTKLEYLRTKPPFSHGYWIDNYDTEEGISLARAGQRGSYIYYLYKFKDRQLLLSQIPSWMTEEREYRNISTACLAFRSMLPKTKYHVDGSIVTIKIGYLYPPSVYNLIKLYSWPLVAPSQSPEFNRILNIGIFNEAKRILEKIGYLFKEE